MGNGKSKSSVEASPRPDDHEKRKAKTERAARRLNEHVVIVPVSKRDFDTRELSPARLASKLEHARECGQLICKDYELEEVPEKLLEVAPILVHLDLSGNLLRELPGCVAAFAQLVNLHLSTNHLETIPPEIGALIHLQVLNFSRNQLRSIPDELERCTSLRVVHLSENHITEFPTVLCRLPNLDVCNVAQNEIIDLPDEIESLTASELIANQNRLIHLNAKNLVKCPRLRTLRIEENCLKIDEIHPDLFEDTSISLIAYAGNLFSGREFMRVRGYKLYENRNSAIPSKRN